MEQARLAAAEEERQKALESLGTGMEHLKLRERQLAEKAFQEERAALQLQHNEELRQLRSQVAASQDEQEVSRTEHESEVERLTPVSTLPAPALTIRASANELRKYGGRL